MNSNQLSTSFFGLRSIGVCLILTGSLAACNNPPDDPTRAASQAQTLSAASTLSAFELIRTKRDRFAIGDRGGRLVTALAAKSLDPGSVQAAVAAAPADPGGLNAALDPALVLTYHHANDDLLVINQAVTRDTASLLDVGLASATAVFRTTFGAIVGTDPASSVGLDPTAPRFSKIVQGEAPAGAAPVERLKEYIFTVPRRINGIEVFGAGVEVSVHRNGSVARVKVFGPTVNSTVDTAGVERPTAAGYSFNKAVDQAESDARVAAEFSKATIKPLGLRYWLPEGSEQGIAAPQYMYMVAPTATVEGKKVTGRAFFVAYSTEDAARAPVVWPHANPAARGDDRK